MDLGKDAIKELFYKQIRELTLKTKAKSFDYQFSGKWLEA